MKTFLSGLLATSLVLASVDAWALPMYAQRSGRTCGNCHISPTYEDKDGWDNPMLSKRKCNMSCLGCHTNPTGGGLRNTSGRYYGQSTLSMLPTQERSYSDYGREVFSDSTIQRFRGRFEYEPDQHGKRNIPSSYEEAEQGIGAGKNGSWYNFGRPLAGTSEYSYWDGRYGDLRADPLVSFGADARSAFWSGSASFFPMQIDLHAAIHPVEHITAMGTLAARGRVAGPAAVFTQEQLPVFPRNAFLMVHELPMMAYAKAGIFMPAFGLYIDDHTSFTREYFEMDVSQSDSTVLGVEMGLAPNYPFASVSFFKNFATPTTPDEADLGFGGAFNLGWRDLGWSLSAHGMIKRRDLEARGDLDAIGVAYGFNPFYYSNSIPLTLMGEFSIGRHQRAFSGETTGYYAMYHELWWTILNGLSFRLKYDLGNRDMDLSSNVEQRVSAAIDVSPIPGITLITQGRVLLPESGSADVDLFIQTHFWF